ncbi:hypothetical protein FDJ25_gp033 [Vibrio phage Aphrodite1]|uniref:Uncharacterized protein n=1 Tax=Vibrio phage Aphrodite1 TaxID=2070057 RepID=A0A2I7QI53_9CAUD|nr:hypothetical protein FDJ25_gp033 [Vibrio phage Aphrodite1]AUR81076.1 hypothetical protein Aphrodite1_0175 [Vibrio phage Aphrodite1]
MFKKENLKIFFIALVLAGLYQLLLSLVPSVYESQGEIVNIREQTLQTTTINFPTVGEPKRIEPEINSFVRYEIEVLIERKIVSCVLKEEQYGLLRGTNFVNVTYEMMDNGEYRCINLMPVKEG